MINKLKDLCSKLVRKHNIEKQNERCVEDDDDNTVAYFHIAVSKDNQLLVEGDFRDGHEEDMSKLVFLISAGALSDFVAEIVYDRCDQDANHTNKILDEAYRMVGEYLDKNDNGDNDDDDKPVVDPCDVFNPKNTGEEEEDDE